MLLLRSQLPQPDEIPVHVKALLLAPGEKSGGLRRLERSAYRPPQDSCVRLNRITRRGRVKRFCPELSSAPVLYLFMWRLTISSQHHIFNLRVDVLADAL